MLWNLGFLTFAVLITVDLCHGGNARERRSPFKKHKIIVADDQQSDSGWGPPEPPPSEETIVEHHHHYIVPNKPPPPSQETIVEHHHHYIVPKPPPPPHSHSVVIEINKGGHGKLEKDAQKLHEFKEAVDEAIIKIEEDKHEKIEGAKKDFEEKLDLLAQIPHKIASDIDLVGRKIAEDIERKKHKEGGISIQVWKGKGDHGDQGPTPVQSSSEEIHHHYYHDNVPPPPPKTELPPPSPPKYGWSDGDDTLEHHITKLAVVGDQFMDQFAGGGSHYRVPVQEESGGGWQRPGGDKGKGFSLSVWKGFGRRR